MLVACITRGLLIIFIGIMLYYSLLFAFDKGKKARLRKTKYYSKGAVQGSKNKIILIYILVLVLGTGILFLCIMTIHEIDIS